MLTRAPYAVTKELCELRDFWCDPLIATAPTLQALREESRRNRVPEKRRIVAVACSGGTEVGIRRPFRMPHGFQSFGIRVQPEPTEDFAQTRREAASQNFLAPNPELLRLR